MESIITLRDLHGTIEWTGVSLRPGINMGFELDICQGLSAATGRLVWLHFFNENFRVKVEPGMPVDLGELGISPLQGGGFRRQLKEILGRVKGFRVVPYGLRGFGFEMSFDDLDPLAWVYSPASGAPDRDRIFESIPTHGPNDYPWKRTLADMYPVPMVQHAAQPSL